MASFDLRAIAALQEGERADAIDDLVASMIEQGVTEDDINDIQRLIDELNCVINQRLRPN